MSMLGGKIALTGALILIVAQLIISFVDSDTTSRWVKCQLLVIWFASAFAVVGGFLMLVWL